MKKNRMMRLASVLLVCVLLTTSVISGTFAKYTTAATSTDTARVANWGFDNTATIDITELFKSAYDNENVAGVSIEDITDVIAPGTSNAASFKFTYNDQNAGAPEVAYSFTVSVDGSVCDPIIANNPNIKWALYHKDDAESISWTDWGTMLNEIKKLSGEEDGSANYEPGELPDAFAADDDLYYVAWKWMFDDSVDGAVNNDVNDTAMGNAVDLANVTLKITIAATQID